jgi:hypothetical protein
LVELYDKFEWTPKQLLTMIRKIHKICPEEDSLNTINEDNPANDPDTIIAE